MTETTHEPDVNGNADKAPEAEVAPERDGPTVPKPHNRAPEIDRKIRAAVERMFEDVRNPYEAVIVASQEARRINDRKLKARSILNQALEQVEELVPEVPFVPRPIEDEEPEVKPTNEAVEKMACGLIEYELEGEIHRSRCYYEGELDFPTNPADQDRDPEEDEPEKDPEPGIDSGAEATSEGP